MSSIQIVIIIMLFIGTLLVTMSWMKAELQCPPPQVVYRYIPQNPIDYQFSDNNKPSEILSDMFNKGTPWIGGYELGNGKTYIIDTNKTTNQ